MPPPGAVSWPLKTRQLSACCLRLGSWLLPIASLTLPITISKSAVLSGLMTLNIRPASVVNLRDDGTAAGGAAGGPGGVATGGCWGGCGARGGRPRGGAGRRRGGRRGGRLRRGGPRARRDRQEYCEDARECDHR